MHKNSSSDPRSIRARKAFYQSLKTLLKEKTFAKISVTEIAESAGYTRNTFYNHFQTKEELLNSLIDSILEEFFNTMIQWGEIWDSIESFPEADRKVGIKLFEIWEDHVDVVELLNTVDIDFLLINRLKIKFAEFLDMFSSGAEIEIGPALGNYFINLNAYAFMGILRQWFNDDMAYSPEVMGEFLNHFVGAGLKRTAVEKFRDKIK